MCGIIGCVANTSVNDCLIEGLKRLEYRGYDSAGIAFFKNDIIKIIKNSGTVESVFLNVPKYCYNIGIGHTRWATHGKATKNNSHPHISFNKKVCIVHNGIIENYLSIKQQYFQNINFKSQTDTEVIANLIEYFYLKTSDKLKSIYLSTKVLKGSYALAILFNDEKDKIYFAKNKSPLLIGTGNNINFVSSDILGFNEGIKKYIEVNDNQYGYVSDKTVKIFEKQKELKFDFFGLELIKFEKDNLNYKHFMLKEINQIPFVIRNIAKQYKNNFSFNKFKHEDFKNIKRIKLIACGTSYHASQIGEKLLSQIGYDATAEIASEFYCNKQNINSNTLCIFLSQSGETADTIASLKLAKKLHCKTLGITNIQTSTISKLCDYVLPLYCGPEVAVASTKAYNSQIACLLILTEYLKVIKTNNFKNFVQNLDKITKKLEFLSKKINISYFEDQIDDLVDRIKNAKTIFMIGKNFDYVTAQESGLKLKEISYLNVCCFPSGELKHGTISLVDKDSLVFAFVTEKKLRDKTINAINQIISRSGKVVLISQFDDLLSKFENKICLPKIFKELYPIISIIPMQLLAYKVSLSLGNNPDKPRNLAKSVTVE